MALVLGVNLATISRFYINKHFASHVRLVVSALYISGRNEDAAVSILTPSLDHIERLITIEKETTLKNLNARKFTFDLESFIEVWQRMEVIRGQRDSIEEKRFEVGRKMKNLIDSQHINTKSSKARNQLDRVLETKIKRDSSAQVVCDEMERLRDEGKKLRSMLKDLMPIWWEIEEIAITQALSLPNVLHEETPLVDDRVLYSFGTFPVNFTNPTWKNIHLLNHSPTAFYLEGSVARQELTWIKCFSQKWKEDGFHPISAPDFVKSIIVDGCALDFNDPNQVWSLTPNENNGSLENGNGFHLTGGASLPAIIAYLAKNVIQEPFPMRLFATGRVYQPAKKSLGLFNTAQASAVQLITSLENHPDALSEEHSKVKNTMTNILQELNVHFRVCATAAHNLERWEQYRSSFQLYSPSVQQYVQVGSVSIVGDYISRRLSIFGPNGAPVGFITAQAFSIPKLLSCYLENKIH